MSRSGHAISWLLLLPLAALLTAPAGARKPKLARYPLRIHVLASDETYRTPRMGPGDSVACDSIDGMLTSMGGSYGGDSCSIHPEIGGLLDIQREMAYSGAGRADLVTPPSGTQGFSFRYDDCARVRVRPGFQSLLARWKKPGKTLEVLVPSDDIPVNGKPLQPLRCTFTVTLHEYVYLLLRNGAIVQVSQADYWRRPVLRIFLSGNVQTVHQRLEQFTVPAYPSGSPAKSPPKPSPPR